jgi:hypothetical protein
MPTVKGTSDYPWVREVKSVRYVPVVKISACLRSIRKLIEIPCQSHSNVVACKTARNLVRHFAPGNSPSVCEEALERSGVLGKLASRASLRQRHLHATPDVYVAHAAQGLVVAVKRCHGERALLLLRQHPPAEEVEVACGRFSGYLGHWNGIEGITYLRHLKAGGAEPRFGRAPRHHAGVANAVVQDQQWRPIELVSAFNLRETIR